MALTISSPSFVHQGEMPSELTCEGKDVAPALVWSGAPGSTKTFALIVDDPDAPDPKAPKMTWVHWVVFNIPATAQGLPHADVREGVNDWKKVGYGGPCPPIGRHRYFFKLYALDCVIEGLDRPTKAQLEQAMEGHVLERAELIGTYQKQSR